MPELNLSNATALSVANKEVLEVRIANQTVWKGLEPTPATHHSVWFPNNYPYALNVATDVLAIRATGFYIYDERYFGSKVVGARMWIPEGVTASEVHLYLWLDGSELSGSKPDFDNPTEIITVPINGTGWVSGMFTVAREVYANSMIYIGYRFDDATAIWVDDITSGYVYAQGDVPIVMSEDVFNTTDVRTWARLDQDSDYLFSSPGRAFGLDVIVDLPEKIPSTFWDAYPTGYQSDTSSGGITLATVLQATVPGSVTHVRFPIPDEYVGTTVTAGIYTRDDWLGHDMEHETIETVVPSQYRDTVPITSLDTNRWKYVALPTPRHIDTNEYMLVMAKFHAEGVNTAYFFPTEMNYFNDPIANTDGTLIAPESNTIATNALDGFTANARYSDPYEAGWPRSVYAARGYHIDVAFLPDNSGGDA